MKKVKEILKEKGIKPSIQRIQIFKWLMEKRGHPTARDIYEEISEKIPTLSKTTVYNSVKIFEERGIIRPIRIKEDETRYDINPELHPHFRCKSCGRLFDLDVKLIVQDKEEIDGHLIEEKSVCYIGVCKDCRKKYGI